jgi:hypothetical protein
MIEDEMKKRQKAAEDAANKTQEMNNDSVGQAGTTVESSNTLTSFYHFCTSTSTSR